MLALRPAGPPPTIATSNEVVEAASSRASLVPGVVLSLMERRLGKNGSARRRDASAQRAAGHEVEESQRRAVRGADRHRRRLVVHHARGVVRVIETECMT